MWRDSDVVESWLSENCTIGSGEKADRLKAFNNFEKFCEDEGRKCLSKNGFYKSLRTKNFTEVRGKSERFFKGFSVGKSDGNKDEFLTVTQKELDEIPFT